jgi:hypothetical protein
MILLALLRVPLPSFVLDFEVIVALLCRSFRSSACGSSFGQIPTPSSPIVYQKGCYSRTHTCLPSRSDHERTRHPAGPNIATHFVPSFPKNAW